jgi:DNA-directed RNA polymerase subunit RPC12/RpoP
MPNPNLKKHYLVVACNSCGRLFLGVSDKRTRTCPYCGRRVRIKDARVIARSESAKEARLVLQEAKAREQRDKASDGANRR